MGLIINLAAMVPLLAFDKVLSVVLAPIPPMNNAWQACWNRFLANACDPQSMPTTNLDQDGMRAIDDVDPAIEYFQDRLSPIANILRWLRVPTTIVALASAVFIQVQASDRAEYLTALKPQTQRPATRLGLVQTVSSSLLPEQILKYRQRSFNIVPTENVRSLEWTYSDNNTELISLSLQYPFRGWHPLEDCYTSRGWKIVRHDRIVSTADTVLPHAADPNPQAAEISSGSRGTDSTPSTIRPRARLLLTSDTGEFAMLIYSILDSTGQPLLPNVQRLLADRTLPLGEVAESTTQVQAFVVSYARPTPEQKNHTETLFAALYDSAQRAIPATNRQP